MLELPDRGATPVAHSGNALSFRGVNLRLSTSFHQRIKDFSEKEEVSINQFISSAVVEKMLAISTEDYLRERASRGSAERLKEIFGKVPDRAPVPRDEL